MIALIDYGIGNLQSVKKALEHVGADVNICNAGSELKKAEKIVLPGVGAFGDGMKHLKGKGFIEPVKEGIMQGKPFLGICLGMQVLFSRSCEGGVHEGLGIFEGEVKKLPGRDLKVPQIGWNQTELNAECPLFKDVNQGSFFYFVHSYYCDPVDKTVVAGKTEYGISFASAVWRGNVFATQFHPEKSQNAGLKILENFVSL